MSDNNLQKQDIDKRIDLFFSSVKEILGQDFHGLLGIHNIKGNCRPSKLSLHKLLTVFNSLNVTIDSVIEDRVDLLVLKEQLVSDGPLPGRYLGKAAFSSRFTGFYMLDFISQNFGKRSCEITMQQFQLKSLHFDNHHHTNNILLSLDLTQHLNDFHGKKTVERMGKSSINHLRSTDAGKSLRGMSSVSTMFDAFFNEIAPKYIESSRTNQTLISGRPQQEIEEVFGKDIITSRPMENLRKGFLTGLPNLIGPIDVVTTQIRSIANGNDRDLYEISYSPRSPSKGIKLH